MKSNKTFNVNEMLVVIIVVSLAAFLLHQISCHVRDTGHVRVQCQSNLSALGRSMVMYQNEFKDKLPKPWAVSAAGGPDLPTWQGFGSAGRPEGDFNHLDKFTLDYFCDPDWDKTGYATGDGRRNVVLCLYLLVKNEGTDPRSFLCPSAEYDRDMSLESIMNWALKQRGWTIEF